MSRRTVRGNRLASATLRLMFLVAAPFAALVTFPTVVAAGDAAASADDNQRSPAVDSNPSATPSDEQPNTSSAPNSPRRTPTAKQAGSAPKTAKHLPKPDESTASASTATTQTTSSSEKAPMSAAALPVGGDKSGVTTKSVSIPKGSGSIEGMGESFSAQLSTGIATFSVPFALPKARGAAQPSLGLSYSSGSGQGLAGQGWEIGVPFIARQTDRGIPNYVDEATWQANQDHFVYNGGQELVPICTVGAGRACTGAIAQSIPVAGGAALTLTEEMPEWSEGWQYFRPRVEGSFLRFFWSPNHQTWRVQDKNGVTLELGVPLDDAAYTSALDQNPEPSNGTSEIYRWHLVRQYDAQGTPNAAVGASPANVVAYRYVRSGGQALLTDIYDTPSLTSNAGLGGYAHHVRLRYEARSDPTISYRSGWAIEQSQRLIGVDVTSKGFGSASGARGLVRRYHLTYAAGWHQSLLESVQIEGRCGTSEVAAEAEGNDGSLGVTNCPRLPAMTFAYQHVEPFTTGGKPGAADLDGYEGFDERIQVMAQSPGHSLDEQLTDLFDVNSDGLSDVLVTAAGLYGAGHGVFFNGVNGARGFGGVTKMGIDGVNGADASMITLRNLNVSTLDLDGDGRVNFLHMPGVKDYAIYDAVRESGNWKWLGRKKSTATRQDPKIDFGKDGANIQVVDVNFDGLVDVVYSSGTELQTFFSLGRYPGGDGQFGQATMTSAITSRISNDPVKTCVPHAGAPVQFGDKEVKLADMNGDGIVDIVRLQRGQIRYWPGRGNGFFGSGRRDDCKAGTAGANRYLEMSASPQFSDIEGDSLRLDDVNGDGLSDLVQVRYDAVDVWLNVDGKGWTTRHIIDGSPYSPSYAERVRLTDINGSGTPDILWGNSEKFQYMDLTGGKKPGILIQVANGLGKITTLEYATSTEEMLAAETKAACPETGVPADADPWSYGWCKKMPTIAHVVKRVTETDNLVAAGQGPSSIVTEYEYRDPVYEGRQREFRGFERARARRLGDANSPTDVSESWFLLGECLDLTQSNGVDDCSYAERWRENPMEALKGLPFATEKRDLSGRTLSTDVTLYDLRKLYDGLDGRSVRHAVAVSTNSYVYDTAAAFTGASAVTPIVVRTVALSTGAAASPEANQIQNVISKSIPIRSSAFVRIDSDSAVDFFGNQYLARKYGCTQNCSDNASGEEISADEAISSYTLPSQLTGDASHWIFRTSESWVEGSAHGANRYGYQKTTYNEHGNPTRVESELYGAVALSRSAASEFLEGPFTVSETQYDDFGNPIRITGANDRCTTLDYDDVYEQLPVGETVYRSPGCKDGLIVQATAYDRGLGLVTIAVDMSLRSTKVIYDGFGRTAELWKPSPDGPLYSDKASVKIEYFLPPALGSNVSAIHTMTEDGSGATDYLESWAFVDGFGRTRTTLTEADKSAGDAGNWVVSGLVTHDAKGAVQRKHIEYFYDGAPDDFAIAAAPTTPYGSQRYDAFGRAVQTFDLDGTMTLKTVYHALSTDMWDAADLSPGPHSGTYAVERKDGHGRSIRATERAHSGNTVQARHVLTSYSPTGQPEVIKRRLGATSANDVTRWMRYDSLGRMVLNVDPHTSTGPLDVPATDTLLAGYEPPEGLLAWTYLYNFAGDLIGTEDARTGPKGRCGVDFTYDALGRLLGEDYFPCEPGHQDHTNGLEVAYYYDGPPAIGEQVPPAVCDPAAYPNGRLVTVRDRAAETTTCVDGRGRVTATARRLGKPLDAAENVDADLTKRYTGQWFYKKALYDAADRPVVETIGGVHGGVLSSFDGAWLDAFPDNEPQDAQAVVTNYSARGTVKSVGGSYGTLVAGITRRADGLVTNLVYGDSAGTQTSTTYDDRRRPTSIQTYRANSALWSAFANGGKPLASISYSPAPSLAGTPTNFQMLLEDTDIAYDEVGNPIELRDWREPSEWPANNKPVTKKIEYDDLYRVRRMDYLYTTATGTDGFQSPYSRENTETDANWDKRRAKPAPHLNFTNRPVWQKFEYDWLGNLSESDDDAHGFYDRSLGTQSHANAGKPYQLSSATNSTHAASSGSSGSTATLYDVTGNLRAMTVTRSTTRLACLPSGSGCNQYYAYDYDEVGRLVRARRWDSTTAYPAPTSSSLPSGDPQIELRYRYDASDQRVIKRVMAAEQRHTLYVFGSLEVRRTLFESDAYTISNTSLVPHAMANGVRLARLHYGDASSSPQVAGTGLGEQAYRTNSAATLHVLLELGDHLGSTGTVLDKLTSELVEKTMYLPFGARENDYRGTDEAGGSNRWSSFREDYGFTGKEEDAEVGLTYFGKRFLSPQLGRWVTADPLAVHSPGKADFNLYAYVSGTVLKAVDPVGLSDADAPEMKSEGPIPNMNRGGMATCEGVSCIESKMGDSTEWGTPVREPVMLPEVHVVGNKVSPERSAVAHAAFGLVGGGHLVRPMPVVGGLPDGFEQLQAGVQQEAVGKMSRFNAEVADASTRAFVTPIAMAPLGVAAPTTSAVGLIGLGINGLNAGAQSRGNIFETAREAHSAGVGGFVTNVVGYKGAAASGVPLKLLSNPLKLDRNLSAMSSAVNFGAGAIGSAVTEHLALRDPTLGKSIMGGITTASGNAVGDRLGGRNILTQQALGTLFGAIGGSVASKVTEEQE